ncbi:Transport protein particle subunit trs85-2 [Schizosaccharomyces pombe]
MESNLSAKGIFQHASANASGELFQEPVTEDLEKVMQSKGLYSMEELCSIIQEAYAPRVSVLCSRDADEFAMRKGYPKGFWELLYPFGDRIRGKVNRRGMNGEMLTLENLNLHFVPIDALESHLSEASFPSLRSVLCERYPGLVSPEPPSDYSFGVHYKNVERWAWTLAHEGNYQMPLPVYVRQLLTGIPITPFETFSHPVAHLVVVTSHNPSPFESLRSLINSIPYLSLPAFVFNDINYLFVYVHDEDQHDLELSMAIFDTMKQTFGDCGYFLRLHSQKATLDYEHTVPFPTSSWLSAEERLHLLSNTDTEIRLLFESDNESLRRLSSHIAFNGIVSYLDKCVRAWDDQYASPRRGITGKLLFASRKYLSSSNASTNSNYFPSSNAYRPFSPEAYLRKLADYSFMLRDYSHANQIYEIASRQYENDGAFLYSAASLEMIVITEHILHLKMPYMSLTNTLRINEYMQSAMLNYLNKSFNSYYHAARCFLLLGQFLSCLPAPKVDDAANWNAGLLYSKRLGPVGRAMIFQQTHTLFKSLSYLKTESTDPFSNKRTRKAALWCVLTADAWLRCRIPFRAKPFVEEAKLFYGKIDWKDLKECVAALDEVEVSKQPASNIPSS